MASGCTARSAAEAPRWPRRWSYSNVVFAGAILVWIFNSLANVIRGTGNMAVPAIVTVRRRGGADSAVAVPDFRHRPVSAAGRGRRRRRRGRLLRRWAAWPWPPICGRGAAWCGCRCAASHSSWRFFRDILRVGMVAALVTIGTNLTIAIATGLVGQFGPAAIAGYGTGSRLEYLLVPLVFGLGGPLVAIVGTNIGAGQRDRALRAAWIGAAMAAALCELIGLWAAAFPRHVAVAVRH